MNPETLKRLKFLAVILIIACSAYFLYLDHPHDTKVKVGSPAIDFTLPSKNGLVSLSSLKGKVVLLNFWATWCPPCREEMPSMQALYEKLKDRPDFAMIAVNVDEKGWTAVDEFLQKLKVSFPILIDPDGILAKSYGTELLPESYLINKNGVVIQKYEGPENWMAPDIVQEIENSLTR